MPRPPRLLDWWFSPSVHLLLADLDGNNHMLAGCHSEGANPDGVYVVRLHAGVAGNPEVVDVAIRDRAHDTRAVGRRHDARHSIVSLIDADRRITLREPDLGVEAGHVEAVAPSNRDLDRDDLPLLNHIV